MGSKNELLLRLYVIMGMMIIAAGVILFRVAELQFVEGEKWRAYGDSLYVKYLPVEATRGNIYSEEGHLLASSMPFFEIRMDLMADGLTDVKFQSNVDSLAYFLSKYTHRRLNQADYKNLLIRQREKKQRYLLIAKNINYNQLEIFKKFPLFREGQFKGGFIVKKDERRERPFGQLARRTIGYVRENAQPVGLEGYFNETLSGKEGSQLMQRLPQGIYIPVEDLTQVKPQKGQNVITTIDIELQDIVHEALQSGLKHHNAAHGMAILMDVKSGAIKAIANLSNSKWGYIESFNYAIGAATEPGSTFKLATMLSLLDDQHVELDDEINLHQGKYKFHDKTMKDAVDHKLDTATVLQAFALSSNVGTAKLADKYYNTEQGKIRFYENLEKFGLTDITGIKIKGEAPPTIKNPKDESAYYSGITIPWMAHGYELSMTPLQILTFYNAVANNGRSMKPYIVSAIEKDGHVNKHFYPEVANKRIASKKSLAKARLMLEEVVKSGTAKRLQSDDITFAGKTGTAITNYSKKEQRRKYQASFAGYFPASNPIYSCIVVVDDPKRNGTHGSSVAGPIFKSIVEQCYAHKTELVKEIYSSTDPKKDSRFYTIGYGPDLKWISSELDLDVNRYDVPSWTVLENSNDTLQFLAKNVKKNLVPNVKGLGARDAIYMLEDFGLKVVLKGKGRVKKQSILPGTKVNGQKIYLNLG